MLQVVGDGVKLFMKLEWWLGGVQGIGTVMAVAGSFVGMAV